MHMAIYHCPSTSRPTNRIQSRLAKLRIIDNVHATTLQMSSDIFSLPKLITPVGLCVQNVVTNQEVWFVMQRL